MKAPVVSLHRPRKLSILAKIYYKCERSYRKNITLFNAYILNLLLRYKTPPPLALEYFNESSVSVKDTCVHPPPKIGCMYHKITLLRTDTLAIGM